MPKKSYSASKGRRGTGTFVALPHPCIDHVNYTRLSYKAIKMLIDLARQYNGFNNGDLTVAFSILKNRGWKSKQTLFLAKEELIHYGWIIQSRISMIKRKPHLYALTFQSIDECKGKLDIKPTNVPPANWKLKADLWKSPEKYNSTSKKKK